MYAKGFRTSGLHQPAAIKTYLRIVRTLVDEKQNDTD